MLCYKMFVSEAWQAEFNVVALPFCVQIITQNQDRFVQMLNEPVTEPVAPLAPGAAGGGQAGGQVPGFGSMSMPDEASYIHVTQEEKQAIDRVCTLLLPGT